MKKSTLLKLALMFVSILMFTGAFAQTNTGATQWGAAGGAIVGDYTRTAATPITNVADPLVTAPTEKITVNKAMPFFVWPSAAYNPNFDYTGAAAHYTTISQLVTNVPSTFAWASATGTLTNYYDDGTTTLNARGIKNYVEISWATTGNKVIQVTETPTGGLCAAVPVYWGVNVIAVPSATIVGAGTAQGLNNVISSACWSTTVPNSVPINVTLPNVDEVYPYNFNVTYEVFNVSALDVSGNLPNAAGVFNSGAAGVTAIPLASGTVHVYGQNGSAYPTAANPRILAAGTELVAAQDYACQNNMITVYRFTYNSVNGGISRNSDYLAAKAGSWTAASYGSFTYYPLVAAPVAKYIISLPAPVTGPIYYISNSFVF